MPTDDIVNSIKNRIEEYIKKNDKLSNANIDLILINCKNYDTIDIIDNDTKKIIEYNSYMRNRKILTVYVEKKDYSFDDNLFSLLESGHKIEYININSHYEVWKYINNFINKIECKKGVQLYLKFCADNLINKEYIDKKTGFNTPNVMPYFEGLAYQETMNYKGYIVEADEFEEDNEEKIFVNIYKNKIDYEKKEPIRTTILETAYLKYNIKKYIDDNEHQVFFARNKNGKYLKGREEER